MIRIRLLALCVLLVGCSAAPTDVPTEGRPELGKAPAALAVSSTSPDAATPDTTLDVHVLGTGFDRGSKVSFSRDGVVDPKLGVNSTTYRTSGELIANVTVAADAATVPYDVVVTTSSGKKGIGTELFAVVVSAEVLVSPSTTSNVRDVGASGIIVGSFGTKCGPGFSPAMWNRAGMFVALPAVVGTCGGVASGVNGAGVAIGSAYVGSSPVAAVRWTPVGSDYAVDQLPMLPNGRDPGPWSINDIGWIGSGNAAAVWTQGNGWTLLTAPSGSTTCTATVLNNTGQLAARCTIQGQIRGVFWASTVAAPVLLPLPNGASGIYPRGIDGGGSIVGFATAASYLAIRWRPAGGTFTVELLPDLGYGGSALGVNEAGYIVGEVLRKSGIGRPAYWEPDGTLHLLDAGASNHGNAVGISEQDGGLVIGGVLSSAVRWLP
jgi:hypothetical protein